MYRYFILIILSLTILFCTSTAQTSWVRIESGTNAHLYGLCFADSNIGFAVGNFGVIVRTTNGGLTWTALSGGTTEALYDIFCINESTATAVGNGIILQTTDTGQTWIAQNIVLDSYIPPLISVFYLTDNIGFAVGWPCLIMKTENGGDTWKVQRTGPYIGGLMSVHFTSPNTGYIVGVIPGARSNIGAKGLMLKTTDGGITWTEKRTQKFLDVCFSDSLNGTVVGWYGGIRKTTDGGVTWKRQSSRTSRMLISVDFINNSVGVAVGEKGTICYTTNGGKRWNREVSGTRADLYDIKLLSTQTAIIVGDAGTILRSTGRSAASAGLNTADDELLLEEETDINTIQLEQNFPNPFNSSTVVSFTIQKPSSVSLKVYDLIGKEISTLIDEKLEAGYYETIFDAEYYKLASGIYLYRLNVDGVIKIKRFMLLK